MWPRECGEADQEVVTLCAGFPRGQAKLQRFVFARYNSWGHSLDNPSLRRTFRSLGTTKGGAGHHLDGGLLPRIEAWVQAIVVHSLYHNLESKPDRARVAFSMASS